MCRGTTFPYFKIKTPIFCCFIFFEECLNPQARINKMAIKHTVNYHPRPSEITLKIYFYLIVLWTPKRFISSEYFFIFFSNLDIPPWLQKSFKFTVLRWKIHLWVKNLFTHASKHNSVPGFHYHFSRQKEIIHLPSKKYFENLFFSRRQREDYGAEKWQKLNLQGYFSNVLINSTICNL